MENKNWGKKCALFLILLKKEEKKKQQKIEKKVAQLYHYINLHKHLIPPVVFS